MPAAVEQEDDPSKNSAREKHTIDPLHKLNPVIGGILDAKVRRFNPSVCHSTIIMNRTFLKLLFISNRHLVELGCIKPLCDLLTLMDSKIVQVALNGLENILRLGELEAKRGGGGINPYCALIEEAYGNITNSVCCLVKTYLI